MSYRLILSRSADKALHKASAQVVKRIAGRIDELAVNPRPPGCVKLTDSNNRFRLRVGDWQILYSIDDENYLVTIHRIVKRDQAYN